MNTSFYKECLWPQAAVAYYCMRQTYDPDESKIHARARAAGA